MYLAKVESSQGGNNLVTCLNDSQSVASQIACALASAQKLLLLDELAAGMNPSETREIMDDICS
jgi:ABC-type branched-subunit amino acid transport system ATPase component